MQSRSVALWTQWVCPLSSRSRTGLLIPILLWKRLGYIVVWKCLFHCYVETFRFHCCATEGIQQWRAIQLLRSGLADPVGSASGDLSRAGPSCRLWDSSHRAIFLSIHTSICVHAVPSESFVFPDTLLCMEQEYGPSSDFYLKRHKHTQHGPYRSHVNRVQIGGTPGKVTGRGAGTGHLSGGVFVKGLGPRARPICRGCTIQLFLPCVQINRLYWMVYSSFQKIPFMEAGNTGTCFSFPPRKNSSDSIQVTTSEVSALRCASYFIPPVCPFGNLSVHPSVLLSIHPSPNHADILRLFPLPPSRNILYGPHERLLKWPQTFSGG
jgi:hypothetical protein